MKQIFLIDYENVGLQGLVGISKLKSADELIIFYSGDISVVSDILIAYEERGVKISYECLPAVGKNALDFMISVRVGYECRARGKKEIHIVSKDNGFKSAFAYAMKLNKDVVVDSYVNIANVKQEPVKQLVQEEPKDVRREKYIKSLADIGVPEKYYVPLYCALVSSKTLEEAEYKISTALGKKNIGYLEAVLKCYECD